MDEVKKRKYTFNKIADNSLDALIRSNSERSKEVQSNWENIKEKNIMKCKICSLEKCLDKFDIINKNRGHSYTSWSTECRECQVKRKTKERHDRAKKNGLEYNINLVFNDAKDRALKKNIDIDIDITFLIELYNKQEGVCYYSGKKMSFDINTNERLSLDRKDSEIGYLKTNVIWCCWQANNMKQCLSIDDMKKWIADIYKTIC